MKKEKLECPVGVYIGRFNPIHLGHQHIINNMLKHFQSSECFIGIGSMQAEPSLRNIFNYKERRRFLEELYPDLNIIGLMDCPNDNDLWFLNMFSILKLFKPYFEEKYKDQNKEISVVPVFFGGSREDVIWAIERGYQVEIINRYNRDIHYSSSEIKDRVIRNESIKDYVDEKILHRVESGIYQYWSNRYK